MLCIAGEAEAIRECISALEFGETVGMNPNRNGFARCIFHNDHNASMKLYKANRGFYCFSCHKGGDVITLAKQWYGLDFKGAVRQINDDWQLGFNLESQQSYEQRKAMREKLAEQKRLRQQAENERKAIESAYWRAFDAWLDNESIIDQNAPVSPFDDNSEVFSDALARRDALRLELEYATERRDSLYGK